MPAEARIRAAIVKAIRARGGRPIKYYGCVYTEAGIADELVAYKGLFVWIETKRPGEKQTPIQRRKAEEFKPHVAALGTAENVAQAMAILDTVDEMLYRLHIIADSLEEDAEAAGCDAGDWDGGSAATCRHCQLQSAAAYLRTFPLTRG